ncbi:hypothetical protein K1T71_001358, partial [Dendrolimus kikuchii]
SPDVDQITAIEFVHLKTNKTREPIGTPMFLPSKATITLTRRKRCYSELVKAV